MELGAFQSNSNQIYPVEGPDAVIKSVNEPTLIERKKNIPLTVGIIGNQVCCLRHKRSEAAIHADCEPRAAKAASALSAITGHRNPRG